MDDILCPLTVHDDAVMFPLYDSKFPYADTFPIDDVMFFFSKVDVISPAADSVPVQGSEPC